VTLFKKHGKGLPVANYTSETKRLYDLVADIAEKPDVLASLETLSLLPLFEQMAGINKEFDALFMERTQKRAETERVNIPAIRTDCDKAITLLWNAIDHCMAEHGAEQYLPLVNAINALNIYYKQQLTARATRRKARQDVSKEEPIQV